MHAPIQNCLSCAVIIHMNYPESLYSFAYSRYWACKNKYENFQLVHSYPVYKFLILYLSEKCSIITLSGRILLAFTVSTFSKDYVLQLTVIAYLTTSKTNHLRNEMFILSLIVANTISHCLSRMLFVNIL